MNLLDIVFPKRCVGCGRLGLYICDRCRKSIRSAGFAICPVCEKPAIDGATHPKCRNKYTIDGLTSFFRYDGVVSKAIKSIKYRFVSDLAGECVSLVSDDTWGRLFDMVLPSFVIPIPLHPARLRERGFNQAEILGKLIAARLHIPIRPDILRRIRKTVPQVEMKNRTDRMANMEKTFALWTTEGLKGSCVLLVDDVFTTGATMRAAANVLKRGGAKHVWGMTIAR